MPQIGKGNPANATRNARERTRYKVVTDTIRHFKKILKISDRHQREILASTVREVRRLKDLNKTKRSERDILRAQLGLSKIVDEPDKDDSEDEEDLTPPMSSLLSGSNSPVSIASSTSSPMSSPNYMSPSVDGEIGPPALSPLSDIPQQPSPSFPSSTSPIELTSPMSLIPVLPDLNLRMASHIEQKPLMEHSPQVYMMSSPYFSPPTLGSPYYSQAHPGMPISPGFSVPMFHPQMISAGQYEVPGIQQLSPGMLFNPYFGQVPMYPTSIQPPPVHLSPMFKQSGTETLIAEKSLYKNDETEYEVVDDLFDDVWPMEEIGEIC